MNDPRLARPLWRGRTNVDAYTIAWIEHAEDITVKSWPAIAHTFDVTQGSYQAGGGDPNSGNTHALGGPVDLRWCGHLVCLLALRFAGGFVWHRTPAQGPWPHHIHGGPLGHPYMDPSAQRQEVAYLAGRNGLKNNGPDDGPRLNPIPRPVWPYPPEEDMPTAQEIADAVWSVKENDGRTTRKMLRQASKAATISDDVADRVADLLSRDPADVTTARVKAAVKQAIRELVEDD